MELNIKQRHLSPTNYFHQVVKKKNIVLHHTVSSSAKSALTWWESQPERIGTAYVIDKDGTIYEAFPDIFWAHHLGLKSSDNKLLNMQSIGIEIVNEGVLFPSGTGYRWLDPNRGPLYNGHIFNQEWRGYKCWAIYNGEQMDSVCGLIQRLCDRFELPPTLAPFGEFDPQIPQHHTIYYHHSVRQDKTDLSPAFNEVRLKQYLKLV